MKILLLGKDGQVGRALQEALAPLGTLIACARAQADLTEGEALRVLVAREAPDVLVNAAAYTAVDRAETEAELALQVNGQAPAVLAKEMARLGGWLVHYSTDYVFDGKKSDAYVEADVPAPLGEYGRSKLAGERAIAASGCRHLLLRTSWVYGQHGENFVRTMLRLGRERDSLNVVSDQFGAPTGAALIARTTAHALQRVSADSAFAAKASGLYHLAAQGATSWHGYAQFVVRAATRLGVELRVTPARVLPITAEAYGARTRRPANSRLDTGKLCAMFGVTMPDWQEGVEDMLRQIHQTGAA